MRRCAFLSVLGLVASAACADEAVDSSLDEATVSLVMDDDVAGVAVVLVEYMHWECPAVPYCAPPPIYLVRFDVDYPRGIRAGAPFELGTFPTYGDDPDCVPEIRISQICGFHEAGAGADCNEDPYDSMMFRALANEQFAEGGRAEVVPDAEIWFDPAGDGFD